MSLKRNLHVTFVLVLLIMSLIYRALKVKQVTIRTIIRIMAHLAPDPNILGNTEMFFIPETIQGSAIWIINGPSANVGVDIRDKSNSAFIYYADSYIGAGANSAQTGTQIPWNRWMRVRLVVYKSGLSGAIVNFIQFLGLDFLIAWKTI